MRAELLLLTMAPLFAQPSPSQDRVRLMADHYASELRRQTRPLDLPDATDYVQRLAGDLLSRAGQQAAVEVVTTGEFRDPVAIAPGHLFIPEAFLLNVQDESELAGMLAHTIGHLKEPTPIAPAPRGEIALVVLFHHSMVPLALVDRYGQGELAADRFGVQLAVSAGFDAAGLRRYIARTPADGRPMSSAPAQEDRLATMDELLRSINPAATSSSPEFDTMKAALAAVHPAKRVPTLRRPRQ